MSAVRSGAGASGDVAAVRAEAVRLAELLLSLDPVVGEPALQRAVDALVERAADALGVVAALADPAGMPGGKAGGPDGDRAGTPGGGATAYPSAGGREVTR